MPRHHPLPVRTSLALLVLLAAAACSTGSAEVDAAGSSTSGGDQVGAGPSTGSPPASTAPTTTEPAPPTTTQPPPPPSTEPPPPAPEEGDLADGAEGPRTRGVQEALAGLGFDPGEVDGRFGAKTRMAVWAFQALHGLAKDGVVTAEVEQQILTAPPLTMLRPDLGPTHTEVDLDRQVLLVWGDGQLELATHVSTGSGVAYCEKGHCGDAVTPVGDYRYTRRIVGPRHAPLGVLYDPVYFVGGIAVHGAPSVPNHPASHGCVRIPMHISTYFQGLVDDGEPIAVFRGGTGPAATVAPSDAPPEPAPEGAENGG